MKKAIITGASQGLGKALALDCLIAGYRVEGYSRTNSIVDENYDHHCIDLSTIEQLKALEFNVDNCTELLVINNAGTLGEICHLGEMSANSIQKAYVLNTIAPAIICNAIIHATKGSGIPVYIINISSGAANGTLDGWSIYNSSKAALNRMSETVAEELNLEGIENIKLIALAPGIVDTEMQSKIRSTKKDQFSNVDQFTKFKNNGELQAPSETSSKILRNFKCLFEQGKTVVSLREF